MFSTRSSSFSICENTLQGMNPTFHLGMLMIPNNLLEVNFTNKGWRTCSRPWASSWNWSHSFLASFFRSINCLLLILCLSCLQVVQNPSIHDMVVLLPWSPNMSKKDDHIYLPPSEDCVCCPNVGKVTN